MSHLSFDWIKRFLIYLVTLIFLASSILVFPAPALAGDNLFTYIQKQIVWRFNPPKGPSPNRRAGGFGRGGSCSVDFDVPLTALAISPPSAQNDKNLPEISRLNSVGGETTEASPTLWFYVPYTRSKSEGVARFMLLDESKKPILEKPINLALTENPGIISVSISSQQPLEVGKSYFWYFSVICDLDHPSRNPSVNGWIRRVPVDTEATEGNDNVWYDKLNTLLSYRRQSPNRIDFQKNWEIFIAGNKGLEKLAQKEIIQCCTVENQPDTLVQL